MAMHAIVHDIKCVPEFLVSMFARARVCVCVCLYVCVHVCECVRACARARVCV